MLTCIFHLCLHLDILGSAAWLAHFDEWDHHLHFRLEIRDSAQRGNLRLGPANQICARERCRSVRVPGKRPRIIHKWRHDNLRFSDPLSTFKTSPNFVTSFLNAPYVINFADSMAPQNTQWHPKIPKIWSSKNAQILEIWDQSNCLEWSM